MSTRNGKYGQVTGTNVTMATQNDNHSLVTGTEVTMATRNGNHVPVTAAKKGKKVQRSDFDQDFVFGSATSAYQIEGGAAQGGKGLSIWDDFTLNKPGKIDDGSNGNVASQQYFMFKEDIKLMKKTGLDAYRFSISWSRVLPGGKLSSGVNKEGIKYYNDLIDAILAEGMQPYATLFHWDLPLVLELEYGGFLDKKIVDDFRDYAELCFWEFGDRVQHWITINEAWTYAYKGYVTGQFPPGRGDKDPTAADKREMAALEAQALQSILVGNNIPTTSIDLMKKEFLKALDKTTYEQVTKFVTKHIQPIVQHNSGLSDVVTWLMDMLHGFYTEHKGSERAQPCASGDPGVEPYKVAHNMLLAHAAAVAVYRKDFQKHQGGEIGMTNNANFYLPYDGEKQKDKDAAARALDFMFYWFVSPLVKGEYPSSMRKILGERLPKFSAEEVKLVQGSYDFLGVNYYTTYYAQDEPNSEPPHYKHDQKLKSTPDRRREPIGPQAGSDWLYIYPKGFYGLLMDIKRNYDNPKVYITENGVDEKANKKHTVQDARHDPVRVDYHRDHLYYMKKAIKKGANVKAYFIWSFADNFEWAEGYEVRFGIFYVDFINGNLTRYPKSSAKWWMNFLGKGPIQKRLYVNLESAHESGLLKKGRLIQHKF